MEILGLCFTSSDGAATGHDAWLVILSYLTAAFASYVALDMAERLRHADGNLRWAWHGAASVALGGGIWAMHFLGMLAFQLEAPFAFHAGLTALSLAVPILVVAVGLWLVGRGISPLRLLAAGVIVGMGVVVMHYTGMAALMLPGRIGYKPGLFSLSVLIALVAATVALWLALTPQRFGLRVLAALVMGIAICGMHYTGMGALVVTLDPTVAGVHEGIPRTILAAAVAAATYGLLVLALVAGIADRRISAAAAREADQLRRSFQALGEEMQARRRMEAELEQSKLALEQRVAERTVDLEEARARAEAASQAKSDFLASMSHELRTPLNSIMGFAQLLLYNRAKEPLTTKQERAATQIEKAGTHLLRLIDEVLDLAKVEAGRLSLSLEPVDAASVIRDVASHMQPVADGANIILVLDIAAGGTSVVADRTRLVQVLSNLVSNAIKYNRSGGRVTLSAKPGPDGRVTLSVSDTGLGIPADRIDQLFQPFNRLGREHGAVEGTGIGLTICQRLVQAMGGCITVDSTEGRGSRFQFDLQAAAPAVSLDMVRTATPQRDGAQSADRTMLYVEDNPANIQLMRDLIDSLGGFRLLVAADPGSGLQLARTHLPDIIILDINLPGMDGFEVLARLRADPATAPIPALALSANALPREVERGKAAGFHRYLTKPLRVPEFLAAVDEALTGRAA
ncbi:MHYT domain-containing protein [Niveispirillum sp.]|uniref:MHYT domain-containing protein n=1 Tax=Niveispirillum sp. TaxID=1917217 RepID=UPI001B53099A|nr:MHYT domain-containing protein [Niveispirillum sp.]MBP7338569.1 response regulator [Niveispirillum sp.]